MAGVVVFRSLSEALRAGYQVYERTASGYLVRTRTDKGWAMAVVICVYADDANTNSSSASIPSGMPL